MKTDKKNKAYCRKMFPVWSMLLCGYTVLSAQTQLKGRVTDWNNNGVPYALVTLANAKLQTQTDMTGYFTFESASPVRQQLRNTIVNVPVTLSGSTVRFTVAGAKVPVTIEYFMSNGRRISKYTGVYDLGVYTHTVNLQMASSAGILRIQIGTDQFVLPVVSLKNGNIIKGHATIQSSKTAPITVGRKSALDIIQVEHFGYIARTVNVPVYDTLIDSIKLDYDIRQSGDPAGMIRIPGGVFTMGNSDAKFPEQGPAHPVFVSPFYMDSTEVTQGEYTRLSGKKTWLKHTNALTFGVDNLIAAWFINWYDAVLYCNLRSKAEGKDTVYSFDSVTGDAGNGGVLQNVKIDYTIAGYRLPTEAEWEYACRAGTRTLYYWGTSYDSSIACQYEWNSFNSLSVGLDPAKKVGMFKPNNLHLYDMASNVYEWCNDYCGDYNSTFQHNPIGAVTDISKVLRGRSHATPPDALMSTFRGGAPPEISKDSYARLGFRVVLPIQPREVK